jgi:DnaJ-class molecular chaperone
MSSQAGKLEPRSRFSEKVNKIPADIVFIIRDKPHGLLKRDGCDLRYTCKVSLREVKDALINSLIERR